MDDRENTQEKRIGRPFEAGNPGRPKGSRNKLAEDFIAALFAAWQKRKDELDTLSFDKLVETVGKLMPKEIKAEIEHRAVMRMPAVHETPDEWLKANLTSSGNRSQAPRQH